jgi:hypothetical protein
MNNRDRPLLHASFASTSSADLTGKTVLNDIFFQSTNNKKKINIDPKYRENGEQYFNIIGQLIVLLQGFNWQQNKR